MNFATIASALALALTGPALAADYPVTGRPIVTVVPSTAGGGTDSAARLLAPLLEKELGVPIEVVNKPGASMQIGNMEVARAKPDGHTLVWTVLPTAASIYLDEERKVANFTRSSLMPIAMYYTAPVGIVVPGNSPYKSVADLIAAAKASPGKVRSGTTGFLGVGHYANGAFQRAAGTQMAVVNFQGGGPQLTALLGGHLDVGFNSIGELLSQRKSGAIRILAVLDDKRSDLLPDVPTVGEAGLKMPPIGSDIGLSAPAGTPQPVIDKLTAVLAKVTRDPALQAKMSELGNSVNYMDTAGFKKLWDDVDERYRELIPLARQQAK